MSTTPQEIPDERPPLPELIPAQQGTDPGSRCGYLKVVGGQFAECRKAGVWHLAGSLQPPSALIVCEDHDRYINERWAVKDRHPVSARCLLAGIRWYPSWTSARGCDVPLNTGMLALAVAPDADDDGEETS